MRYNKVYLFSVPYDSNYKNVPFYKFQLTKLSILNKYISLFPHHEILINEHKSININEDVSTVNISIRDFNYFNYNYIIFVNEGEEFECTGFFIIDFTTLNDIEVDTNNYQTNVRFTIKYDVWFNNMDKILNDNSYNTLRQYNWDRMAYSTPENDDPYVYPFGGTYLPAPEVNNIGDTENAFLSSEDILWLKIICESDSIHYLDPDPENPNQFTGGAITLRSTRYGGCISDTICLYLPVGLLPPINSVSDTLPSDLRAFTNVYAYDAIYRGYYRIDFLTRDKILSVVSNQYVISATFTTIGPAAFSSIIDGSSLSVYVGSNSLGYCYRGAIDELDGMRCIISSIHDSKQIFINKTYTLNRQNYSFNDYFADGVKDPESINTFAHRFLDTNSTLQKKYMCIGTISNYVPHDYELTEINMRATPCNYGFYVSYQVKDASGTIIPFNSNIKYIPDSTYLVLRKDQLETYMRNSTATIDAKKDAILIKGTINTITSTAEGVMSGGSKGSMTGALVGGGINLASGVANTVADYGLYDASIKAKKADLKNMRDDYEFPSSYFTSNPYWDRIYVKMEKLRPKSPESYETNVKNYIYGYDYNCIVNLRELLGDVSSRYYNYVRFSNFEICRNLNNHDRNVINAIMNKGVRMWYISTDIPESIKSYFITCNPFISNQTNLQII